MVRKLLLVLLPLVAGSALAGSPAFAHNDAPLANEPPVDTRITAAADCVGGTAAGYSCNNVDLLAQLPLSTIGGGSGNDIWGWTDPQTGREYALVGRTNGTAFVDITNPSNPTYLGNLPTATTNSSWRDIKVYANHAYIVSEAASHGLQVFNLTRLRSVANPPVTFSADARNTSFGNAHNLAINTDSGFAYVIGSSTCSGGPRMFNLSNPTNPAFAGCVSGDGYTHDTQGVIYDGPHAAFRGREILFNSNEDTLTIVDATNKSSPTQLSRTGYTGRGYTHQGWLTEDHRYFLLDDETDETRNGHGTRTYVFDVSNLNNPVLRGHYTGPTAASDHNLYVKGDHVYEANYRAGLRIVSLANVANPSTMTEVAHFDVYPESNSAGFAGAWSSYPYFASGTVIVNSIQRGLFVLRPRLDGPPPGETVVWADDFEAAQGWTTDPSGTDTATSGAWERGDPQPTSSSGTALQQGTTTSGGNDLVTGRLAGSSAGVHDIDGGETTVRSPSISLPGSGTLTLSFSWYLAHLSNASTDDYLRVQVVHSGGTTTVLQQLGSPTNRAGSWATATADLSAFAGQSVRLLIRAADAGGGSLVEAGIDDVRITSD
jgi:choice-of-anchor B domain-containing protein